MSLIIKTKSHGEIDGGFSASFTESVGFGEYDFPTRNLCDLIRYLSDHPEIRRARLATQDKTVPVEVALDDGDITVGKYRISAHQFGILAYSVARGGLFGWKDGKTPEFAESALEAMRYSENPLFKYAQQKLEE
jgi:hypothetical protein